MDNARIFEEFSNKLIIFFKKRVQRQEDAKDLAQEVFLKINRYNGNGPVVKNIGGWVYTIANNTLIDYYRKKKIQFSEAEEGFEQVEPDRDEKLSEGLFACLKRFLGQLDPETREILEWVELNQGSQKELADRLGLSYPTLRSKVQRGRKKMLKLFQESCHILYDPRGGIIHCETKCQTGTCNSRC